MYSGYKKYCNRSNSKDDRSSQTQIITFVIKSYFINDKKKDKLSIEKLDNFTASIILYELIPGKKK